MLAQLDAGLVVLRTVKRTLVIGPRSNRPAMVATSGRGEFFGRGVTINSELSVQILKKLEQIRRVRSKMKMKQFPSCLTTPDCTPDCAGRGSCSNGVYCLPNPPYSPDLAPTDFTFLDPCVN